MKQLDPIPAGVEGTGWKARVFQETKTAIVRGERKIIGADLLMYKKKTFVEAITCGVWEGEGGEDRERERNIG